jgi:hypothetical protein
VALTGPEQAARLRPWLSFRDAWSQLKTFLLDAEHLLAQRLAGTVFLIRVASALLAFGSQVLFARWMGSFEFGIYVYGCPLSRNSFSSTIDSPATSRQDRRLMISRHGW